jgi:deoxyribodipyrimidine photolyase-related protein
MLILLPIHLGEDIEEHDKVVIYEEPLLYDAHKVKCAFLRAIVLASGYKTITESEIKKSKNAFMYDPLDNRIRRKFPNIQWLELRNSFMLQDEQLEHLRAKFQKNIVHGNFFKEVKKEFGIFMDVPSTDKENRKKLARGIKLPKRYIDKNNTGIKKTAIRWAESLDRFGSAQELINLPITHKSALAYFNNFVETKLEYFGVYEDAIVERDVFVYHSHISFLLNCGLLTPQHVIKLVLKSNTPINSREGFIRQVLGWREYMRFIYRFWGDDLKHSLEKLPGNHLNWKDWTTGNTGIYPVDIEIKKVWEYGWCHHIIRLMIFLNLMKLNNIKPHDIYLWFLRFVSLDAYEWVMVSNIMAMGYFANNPKFMTREYTSTSAYILRMSDYSRGEWCEKWPKKARGLHGK